MARARIWGWWIAWIVMWSPLMMMGNTLTKAVVQGDRLLLSFSHPFNARSLHTFRLVKRGSIRYVYDLKKTRLGSSRVPLGLHHPRVSAIRISQYRPSTVRIVVETPKRYRMVHDKRSSRLYFISLPKSRVAAKPSVGELFSRVKTDANAPHTEQTVAHTNVSKSNKPKRTSSHPKTTPHPVTAVTQHHSASSKATHLRHRYTVILDPGHGGHDSGAIAGGKREKDAVLQIARRVRDDLRGMGIRVIMTRASDRFVPLGNRTRFANRKKGDVFVSIHANAIEGKLRRSRQGVETFFLQTTRSDRAKRVAARENSVVLNRSDRLSKNVILNSVMTGPKIVLSNKLAIDVQRHILGNLRRTYRDVHDGGVRPAPFWVLVGAEMPAVLVEVGYISHPKERKRLFNPHYQKHLAKGIAEGIASYLRNREREME